MLNTKPMLARPSRIISVSGSPDGVLSAPIYTLAIDVTNGVEWQNTNGASAWWPKYIPPRAGFLYYADALLSADAGTLGAGTFAGTGEAGEYGLRTFSGAVAGVDGVQCAAFGVGYNIGLFGGGIVRSRTGVRIPVLSDGTNNIVVRACMHDILTAGGDATDGAYMEYDFATHANHNWWLCTASNGSRTKADTGIAAVASSTAFQVVEVRVNAAGTSVVGYVNGVAGAATNTTNIPTGAGRNFAFNALLAYKQLGAGTLTCSIGFWDSFIIYTTNRAGL